MLGDVMVGSPAFKAGIGPGMKLIAVNRHKYSGSVLKDAITAARNGKAPIELLVENAHLFRTVTIDYHDGLRNPHLERVADKPDLLGDILKAKAGSGGWQ